MWQSCESHFGFNIWRIGPKFHYLPQSWFVVDILFCSISERYGIHIYHVIDYAVLFRSNTSPSKLWNSPKFLIKFTSLSKFPQNYHTDNKSNNTSAFISFNSLLNASKEFIYYFSSGIISPLLAGLWKGFALCIFRVVKNVILGLAFISLYYKVIWIR